MVHLRYCDVKSVPTAWGIVKDSDYPLKMESHRDFSALSHDNIALSRFKPQKIVCLTLGYPLLTIVTPLLTLLLLYVLFDCLDEEMCFKTESHDPK